MYLAVPRTAFGPESVVASAALASDAFLEGAAWHVLHRDVVAAVPRTSLVVDLHDVLVVEGCGAPGLPEKTLQEHLVLGQPLLQDLQRHVPPQVFIVPQVDLGHAPAAEAAEDLVAAVEEGRTHGRSLPVAARRKRHTVPYPVSSPATSAPSSEEEGEATAGGEAGAAEDDGAVEDEGGVEDGATDE